MGVPSAEQGRTPLPLALPNLAYVCLVRRGPTPIPQEYPNAFHAPLVCTRTPLVPLVVWPAHQALSTRARTPRPVSPASQGSMQILQVFQYAFHAPLVCTRTPLALPVVWPALQALSARARTPRPARPASQVSTPIPREYQYALPAPLDCTRTPRAPPAVWPALPAR